MPIRDLDLRWLLEGMLRTTEPELAEHRGYARAKLGDMGRTRGRKPGQKNRPKAAKKAR